MNAASLWALNFRVSLILYTIVRDVRSWPSPCHGLCAVFWAQCLRFSVGSIGKVLKTSTLPSCACACERPSLTGYADRIASRIPHPNLTDIRYVKMLRVVAMRIYAAKSCQRHSKFIWMPVRNISRQCSQLSLTRPSMAFVV